MRKLIGWVMLIFVGVAGWKVGENLSSDAVSMAVGLIFGVMAGIPTTLLVLSASRRESDRELRRQPQNVPLPMPKMENHYHIHFHDQDNQNGRQYPSTHRDRHKQISA